MRSRNVFEDHAASISNHYPDMAGTGESRCCLLGPAIRGEDVLVECVGGRQRVEWVVAILKILICVTPEGTAQVDQPIQHCILWYAATIV